MTADELEFLSEVQARSSMVWPSLVTRYHQLLLQAWEWNLDGSLCEQIRPMAVQDTRCPWNVSRSGISAQYEAISEDFNSV